jgi:hypothetical protein
MNATAFVAVSPSPRQAINIEGYRQEDIGHVGVGDNALLNVDAFT